MSAFDQAPAPDTPSTDAFEAAMAARGGYDAAPPDGGAGGDGAASEPDWSVYRTDDETAGGAFGGAFEGAPEGADAGLPGGGDFDVVAAYREAYPGTAASTPEGVMEEVRTHLAREADERALYGRFDALLEDPATEAFLAARLAGYSAEEAAQAADLQDWGPDPEADPHAYAEWYARRAVSQAERARQFEAWRAEEDHHAWRQEQAEVMGERFLAAERLTDADRAYLTDRARLVVFGDDVNPPRVDLLLDALLRARDYDAVVAERDGLRRRLGGGGHGAPFGGPGAAPYGAQRPPMPTPRGGTAPPPTGDPARDAFRRSLLRPDRLEFE